MKKMIRSGFTMIELIFVIVILGILAAVALPKFVGAGEEAHIGNLKSFEGTLNRTVAPTAWAKVASKGGSLTNLEGSAQNLSTYTEIPTEFGDGADANLKDAVDKGTVVDGKKDIVTGQTITSSDNCKELSGLAATINDKTYKVCVIDGTSTSAPKFHIYSE